MKSDKHSQVQMKQVHSSHVHAIGYDPVSGDLHVEYKNGGKFVYKNVPPDKARAVLGGASIGKMLHTHIRGQHDFEGF